jgi:tetratricopeptide (TPR) repeat protein
MKFRHILLVVGPMVFGSAVVYAQNSEEAFYLGNAALQEGNIEEAIIRYQEAQKGGLSAATSAQLAHCYEIQNQPGKALLHLERAQRMDPQNLSLQKTQNDWIKKYLPSHPIPSRIEMVVLHYSNTFWSYLSCMAIWLFLILVAYPKISTMAQKTLRNTLWSINVLLFFAAIPGIYYVHQKYRQAIITNNTSICVAPTAKSPVLHSPPIGEYLYPQQYHNGFYHITSLDHQYSGWLASRDMEWIIPRSS